MKARQTTLVRFVPSGEYAWLGRGGATWPENAFVMCWRASVPADLVESRLKLESSELPS